MNNGQIDVLIKTLERIASALETFIHSDIFTPTDNGNLYIEVGVDQ